MDISEDLFRRPADQAPKRRRRHRRLSFEEVGTRRLPVAVFAQIPIVTLGISARSTRLAKQVSSIYQFPQARTLVL
jgi:hypothetical protein